jgi:hypothetical protein
MSAKKLDIMQFALLRAARRSVAWQAGPGCCLVIVACAAGCSNEVHEIPTNDVHHGGTYLVAGLRNERPQQTKSLVTAARSNMTVSEPVTPPNVDRETMLRRVGFVRADDNGCIGADTIALEFPKPGVGTRYVAFTLPAGTYTAYGRLRDHDTRAPTFAVRSGEVSYLGDLTLEPNADISITPNLAEAQRHVRATLRPVAVGYAEPARRKICTP